MLFANASLAALTDTREASQLFSYAKEAAESGALDLDERAEDGTGGCHEEFHCCDGSHSSHSFSLFPRFLRWLNEQSVMQPLLAQSRCLQNMNLI